MTLYRAYNAALPVTTALALPVSYAAGAKMALQIAVPSGQEIELVGYGIAMDEDPTAAVAANATQWEIVANATATTGLTTHTTTTIKPFDKLLGRASSMTMGTGATGYSPAAGAVAITTATPARVVANGYCPPTGGLDYIFPSDMRPVFGNASAAEYLQFRVNTTITVNLICYFIWAED